MMSKSDIPVTFIVYGRKECHLCQEMIVALSKLQEQVLFRFQIIDIDHHPELIVLYGDKVPVLVTFSDKEEICHYHLDIAALDAYFTKVR